MLILLIKCTLNCTLTKSINPSPESPGLQASKEVVTGRMVGDFNGEESSQKSCIFSPRGRLNGSRENLRLELELPQLSTSYVFSLSGGLEVQYVLN